MNPNREHKRDLGAGATMEGELWSMLECFLSIFGEKY
jgi:hypothetical protein